MRTKLTITWNIALLLLGAFLLIVHVPRAYDQAHYQFTNPHGGPSMWPATFDGFFSLSSVLTCITAFSFLFGGALGATRRCAAGLLAFGILAAWIVSAWLWQSYGSSQNSLLGYMIRQEVSPINAIGISVLTLTAVVGKGPLPTLYDLFCKFRERNHRHA